MRSILTCSGDTVEIMSELSLEGNLPSAPLKKPANNPRTSSGRLGNRSQDMGSSQFRFADHRGSWAPERSFERTAAGHQPGFSLIGLLIMIGVFTLMVVTAVPAYTYFLSDDAEHAPLVSRPAALQVDAEVQAAELLAVQRAMDAMMASRQIAELDPSPMHGTDNFEALPSGAGVAPLYPDFLRVEAGLTECVYMWTGMGQVYQFTCP